MKLSEIERRIHAGGIKTLNPLQRAAAASSAQQLVILAPTGTGKTLAFAIAALRMLPATPAQGSADGVLAVSIAPSRELVLQICQVIKPLAAPPFKVMALYGGSSFSAEHNSIRGGVPNIVVATPGRLLDHINRQTLNIENSRVFVIDEYDKVLDLGFSDELRRIVHRLKNTRGRILTSATRPAELPGFISADRAETLDFTAGPDAGTPAIAIVRVPSAVRDKLDTLASLLRDPRTGISMVFVNHRESAERVVESLKSRNIPATLYHGGMEQRDREIAVAKLRAGVARVLVATDLAARGLDIDAGIDSVIHYHLPVDETAWTHRNGRTARAGATGSVYVITGPDEDIPDYIAFQRDYYPQEDPDGATVPASEGNAAEATGGKATEAVDGKAADNTRSGLAMLYLNAGKQDKISKGDVAGFMMKVCGLDSSAVGLITVGRDYSLVAVPAASVPAILDASRNGKLKGHRVKVTVA